MCIYNYGGFNTRHYTIGFRLLKLFPIGPKGFVAKLFCIHVDPYTIHVAKILILCTSASIMCLLKYLGRKVFIVQQLVE